MTSNYPYKISVVIVNYNVAYFLEQCLNSVKKALQNVSGEVFVVDNNSIDNSVEMVKAKFPEYHLIANKDNRGFSKANNQAIEIAKGEYILLLNPDTVVEEDTFEKVIQFMDQQPKAGGLGVRMLDGKGKFLPESKRGLPTPMVAFYKIFGLSRLFPKSKKFGQYHLGYLSEFETNEVEILSGAFMLMRHDVLKEVGLLDETFFMYGEDIDLSYRIIKGGYKNYYFPETRIIHYKGESTKKSSVNYVFVFYQAMVIFAEKHFSQRNAKLFSFLINFAIYLRAGLAILARFFKKAILPIADFTLILGGLYAITHRWELFNIEFPNAVLKIALPFYTITWLLSIYFQNGYLRPFKLFSVIKGLLWGTLFILVVYALLPKDYQFSRLFIVTGAVFSFIYFITSRLFMHFAFGKSYKIFNKKDKRFAIVGSLDEAERVFDILKQTFTKIDEVFYVSPSDTKENWSVGKISQLDQIAYIYKVDEIVFCAKNIDSQSIIQWMSIIDSTRIDFKIAQPDSLYLIGSNSIDTAGDLYLININAISKPENIRNKRLLDLFVGIIGFLLSPLLIWFYNNKKQYFINVLSLIIGKKTCIGYLHTTKQINLPKLKKGVLPPTLNDKKITDNQIDKVNLLYARDYSVKKDLHILSKMWKKMDNSY
ncbi:MAG: glycosyltransferase family 2 protein [Crocinitomicaceae bacterium]|nr:glycosyltransferase family 2 protein [Crocinitomicaceae bacterium]